jgi:hypothetical protein
MGPRGGGAGRGGLGLGRAGLLGRQERGDGRADWREIEVGGDGRLVWPLVQEFFEAEEGADESRVDRAAKEFVGDAGAGRR